MNETQMFLSGLTLGCVITFSVCVLVGQWLFATGAVFRDPDLTRDEAEIIEDQRLRELVDEALEVASWQPGRWPSRPRRMG